MDLIEIYIEYPELLPVYSKLFMYSLFQYKPYIPMNKELSQEDINRYPDSYNDAIQFYYEFVKPYVSDDNEDAVFNRRLIELYSNNIDHIYEINEDTRYFEMPRYEDESTVQFDLYLLNHNRVDLFLEHLELAETQNYHKSLAMKYYNNFFSTYGVISQIQDVSFLNYVKKGWFHEFMNTCLIHRDYQKIGDVLSVTTSGYDDIKRYLHHLIILSDETITKNIIPFVTQEITNFAPTRRLYSNMVERETMTLERYQYLIREFINTFLRNKLSIEMTAAVLDAFHNIDMDIETEGDYSKFHPAVKEDIDRLKKYEPGQKLREYHLEQEIANITRMGLTLDQMEQTKKESEAGYYLRSIANILYNQRLKMKSSTFKPS